MVILRTERVFCQSGKDKFAECYLSISFDSTGPNFTIYKDKTAKKQLLETIELRKSAEQIRFGTTARPYGNLPVIRKDKRQDPDNFIVFQVERVIRKNREPRLVWLCADSAKQMFGILKIFATCLTYLDVPAPDRNHDVDDPNSLAKYKPHLLNPANNWERFWENPPPARLLTALELARALTKSLDAVNRPVERVVVDNRADSKKIQKTVVQEKYQAPPPPPQRSSWKRGSTSSSGSTSKTSSNRFIPVHALRRMSDLPKRPLTITKPHKYEKNEAANSSPPLLRQKATLQKRISEGRVEVSPLKSAPEVAHVNMTTEPEEVNYVYYVPRSCHCFDHVHPEPVKVQPVKRPMSSYSSAYGSAPQTPTHLQSDRPLLDDPDLLRRMSELSLRPVPKRPRHVPLLDHNYSQYGRGYGEHEQTIHLPHEESDDVEVSVSETEQRVVIMISRGIQTDHDLPEPPTPLIDDYGYAQVKRYTPENVRDGRFSRMSMASLRSVYLRHLETDDMSTVDPLIQYPLINQPPQEKELRTYTVEISQASQF